MLSSLSCFSITKKARPSLNARLSIGDDKLSSRKQQQQSKFCKSNNSPTLFIEVGLPSLVVCFLLLSVSIQCGDSKHLRHESVQGEPCICNQTFYKQCPKPSECIENKASPNKIGKDLNNHDNYRDIQEDHDYLDPDHVDSLDDNDFNNNNADFDNDYGPNYPAISGYDAELSSIDPIQAESRYDDDGRVKLYRKVYVAKRKDEESPILPSLKLTIPVKIPEAKKEVIPWPRPRFQLRKYVTYETRPEVQMVPVTKKIIKPVGVKPEEIINNGFEKSSIASLPTVM